MSYQATLAPVFSWSKSRDNLFSNCLRAYYFHYYASHNGWLAASTEESRSAYRLRQLQNLYMVFGDAVHRMAKYTLDSWIRDGSLPEKHVLTNGVRRLLNQAYLDSLDRSTWHFNPKGRTMLHEMYYHDHLPSDVVESIKNRQITCMDNLLVSGTTADVINTTDIGIEEAELLRKMELFETAISVKLDLMYRIGNDRWVIVDWKTGSEDDKYIQQLQLYALYLNRIHGVSPINIELRLEYLNKGIVKKLLVTDSDLKHTEGAVLESMRRMKSYLSDEKRNVPQPIDSFEPNPSFRKCALCNFQEICKAKIL